MSEYLYGFKPPKTLYEMTWEELQEAVAQTDLVIVPIGSVEQHGPHLPLGNDAMQVREMARRLVVRLDEKGVKAVAGPLIPFGIAPYHLYFPGTISLQSSTFQAVMRDVCLSLYRHGFRRFAFPLGHGGNLAAMHVVAQQLIDETEGTQAMVLNWLQLAVKQYKQLLTSGKNEGHAGEGETARMLALHPELVEIGRAQIYYSEEADRAESADHPLHGGGIFKPSKSWRDVTPVGNVGNPKIATAETGEKMWDLITTWMANAIAVGFDGKPMGGS